MKIDRVMAKKVNGDRPTDIQITRTLMELKRVIFMQKLNFFVKQIFFQDEVEILTFFDGDDDEVEYRCNLVNFQVRTSRFCMEVDLDNI